MSRSPLDPALLKFPARRLGPRAGCSAARRSFPTPALRLQGPRRGAVAGGCRLYRPAGSQQRGRRCIRRNGCAARDLRVSHRSGGRRFRARELHAAAVAAPSRPTNVYPVARQDMVVGIQGPGIQTLLRQICSVDFVPLFESSGPAAGPIVLTSMVGVGVVAWPRRTESGPALRVWLDPSFAHYFWTTLLEVGRGVGALVIGSNT